MATRLADIAELVGGTLLGDGQLQITGAAALADALGSDITLIDTRERADKLSPPVAAAAIVPRGVAPRGIAVIQVDDVHAAFATVVGHFRSLRPRQRIGVSGKATISLSARLDADVDVYPGATIGDDCEIGTGSTIHAGAHIMAGCKLGDHVTVFPNAVLYDNTIVGPRSIIHACAVLGANGFGYKLVDGRYQLAGQLGWVELGADVEVGAGATIDRGTYGPTTVGEGTKIDNQVMIAHNCRIGRHNMLCSQVGIAGSTTTGDYVVMAGQVGVRDHVHIGARAVLGAMAGVINDVPDGVTMIGIPATPERDQKVKQAALAKLPELRRQLKALQTAVEQLQREHGNHDPQKDDQQAAA
jgi:UDP-3-O-[3-hydroxymyristoyl] glucosamine N-acyltransferase